MNPESREITEADVVAFLTTQAAKLAAACGQQYVFIGCNVGNPSHGATEPTVNWTTYVAGDTHRTANNLDSAIQNAIEGAAPAALIKAKREKAAKLLAEAEELTTKIPAAASESPVEQPANAS